MNLEELEMRFNKYFVESNQTKLINDLKYINALDSFEKKQVQTRLNVYPTIKFRYSLSKRTDKISYSTKATSQSYAYHIQGNYYKKEKTNYSTNSNNYTLETAGGF